ncbi:MAG: phytanoyl-CoA dioxygenase family protein [Candidatus Hydrogenedentes bacterium]|nr:phytanoyl-CoA dioxygenase family protein [Candidatus Hydrogenedentota bacterium]
MLMTKHASVFYDEHGYYLNTDPVLEPGEIAAAVRGMEDVRDGRYETGVPPEDSPWTPGDDPRKLVKIEMPQQCNRAIRAAVASPRLGEAAAEITGASMVQVWWVQLLMKPPVAEGNAFRTNVGWHQDFQYWDCWAPGSEVFTAWLALSDVTEAAGAMRFVPGSHTWGLLGQGDFYGQELDGQIAVPEGREWREASGALPPGGVSFHHRLTLHASGPNTSGAPRLSLAIHLRTEKSTPAGGEARGLAAFIGDTDRCPVIWSR